MTQQHGPFQYFNSLLGRIRNPNTEIRNKFELSEMGNNQNETSQVAPFRIFFLFGNSVTPKVFACSRPFVGVVSCFELRVFSRSIVSSFEIRFRMDLFSVASPDNSPAPKAFGAGFWFHGNRKSPWGRQNRVCSMALLSSLKQLECFYQPIFPAPNAFGAGLFSRDTDAKQIHSISNFPIQPSHATAALPLSEIST